MAKCIRSGPGHRRRAPQGDPRTPGADTARARVPPSPRARPQERLLRVERDLLREIAGSELPAVVIERACDRIRSAGRYRSVRYLPGAGIEPAMFGDDPALVAVPVGVNDRQHGLLVVETDPFRPPDRDERLLLEECADDLALALHLERIEHERRQNLLGILESEERFRQVFHQTNDAVLLYEVAPGGRDHRCLEANQRACRWLGYSLEDLRRHRPEDLMDPPDGAGTPPWDRADPGPYRFDACVRLRTGPTTAEVSLHRFNLLGREVMLVVARDVAEERRIEMEQIESLRQIQANMEQFQILNDQIRNPVQVIIGLADLEGGEVAGRIIRQAHEIDEIVRKLDVGWLESAKVSAYLRRYGS